MNGALHWNGYIPCFPSYGQSLIDEDAMSLEVWLGCRGDVVSDRYMRVGDAGIC